MGFLDRVRGIFAPLRNYVGAMADGRKLKAWERRRRDGLATAGSGWTSHPKRLRRSLPVRPFRELTSALVTVPGKKKRVRVPMLCALDSTPNRHTFARLRDPKRRPKIRRLNKAAGRFEYLPQYR